MLVSSIMNDIYPVFLTWSIKLCNYKILISFRVRKLGEDEAIRQDDFAATLPKPSKKKRKIFQKYSGHHSDSDFD